MFFRARNWPIENFKISTINCVCIEEIRISVTYLSHGSGGITNICPSINMQILAYKEDERNHNGQFGHEEAESGRELLFVEDYGKYEVTLAIVGDVDL